MKFDWLLLFHIHFQGLKKGCDLSRGHTSDFLLAQVMRFFQILSRRQREMKIARVATFELATRQVKKSQEKVARIEIFATKS